MITVTLYTRKDCHLCEQAKADLESLQEKYPHRLVEIDIDSDPVLQKKYLVEIPVVEVGPYVLKSPFDKQKLMMTLGAAGDRRGQLDKLGRPDHHDRVRRGQTISRSDRIMDWISRHYLALINFFILLYFGLPILAPVLMKSGATVPANVIYTIYKPLCHQFGFRSFFLFGEQAYYPLAEAGISGVKTFEQVTGFEDLENPLAYSRLQARQFTGNETVGYKIALCERDIAIYGAILLFGIVYALTGRRIKPLHWIPWILIGLGPIGLDGFSQLFSQMEWSWLVSLLPYRESTPFLRVLTGGLFGLTTAWFAYPYMEESMTESRQFFIKKFESIRQNMAASEDSPG
ncbi:MAG TPA: glutaredoxin family protein [Anaerolineales bacterium]|nr:glutaredoxin family protein [Anaerolineales bacterium]